MENKSNRKPVKKRHSSKSKSFDLREFISDNLRYILIAAAVLVIIIVIVAIVSGSKGKSSDSSKTDTSSEISTEVVSEATTTPEVTKEASAADTQEESTASTEDANAISDKVYTTISTYLNACSAGDADTAASVSEKLSDDTKNSISALAFPASYTNLVMYLYNGTNAGEYVAICTFDYTARDTGITVPGMSSFYLITDGDSIKMASDETIAANQDMINEVLGYPEIVELVTSVNEAIAASQNTGDGTQAA